MTPREWVDSKDARRLVRAAAHVVDRRLLIVAAAQCARTVLFLTDRYGDNPDPLAVTAIETAEKWVERWDTHTPVRQKELRDA